MGDALDEDQWEVNSAENEEIEADYIDDIGEDNDDDEISVDSAEEKQLQSKLDKKNKRKQKFQEMKEKKRQKLQEGKEIEQNNIETDDSQGQFTPEKMVEMLSSDLDDILPPPERFEDHFQQVPKVFTSDNFFFPTPVSTSLTESQTKKSCPFVRALSASLPNYKKILLKTNEEKENYGSPVLLIVCASAIRATSIIKSVSSKLIKCKIAKLFAKHFKVEEHVEMLSKEYFPIAIGTPNRVQKLISLGALSLHRTKIVLMDYTPDAKNFTLLTLPEVKKDFYSLLYGPIYSARKELKLAIIKDTETNTEKNNKQPERRKLQVLKRTNISRKGKN